MTTHTVRNSIRTIAVLSGAALALPVMGASSSTLAATPHGTNPPPAFGTIWVVNSDVEASSIVEYAPTANGDVAPVATIAGADTGLTEPNAIAVTPAGALWVAQASGDAITEYAPGAHGDAAPIRTIAGASTGLNVPISLALAPDGSLWVMNNGGPASLEHFAANANGNVAPLATIAGSNTTFASMRGVALTPDGTHIWTARTHAPRTSALLEFATKQNGNVAPVATISGAATGLGDTPYGIAVNGADQVIVSNDSPASITTYARNASGNAAPLRTVSGATSHVTGPSYLATDALGRVWFENYADNNVVALSARANGDAAPIRLIAGSKTQLTQPNAVAVLSAAPSVPRHVMATKRPHHKVVVSWHKPASDGGGVVGYAAYLKKSKHSHWAVIGASHRRSLTVKLAAKKRYRIAVAAINNDGTSAKSKPAKIT